MTRADLWGQQTSLERLLWQKCYKRRATVAVTVAKQTMGWEDSLHRIALIKKTKEDSQQS